MKRICQALVLRPQNSSIEQQEPPGTAGRAAKRRSKPKTTFFGAAILREIRRNEMETDFADVTQDLKEALIKEDFCSLARKASSGRSEVYQDIHELRTGRA